jgi:uncharacterized protein (TIGR03435 family)
MRSLILLLAAGLVYAQQFEVASVKQAVIPAAEDLRKVLQGGGTIRTGMQVQGNQVSFNLMSLRELAMTAYGMKPLQVNAPDWMQQQRYDIAALLPEGADPKQIPAMLQALLKERFKLVARKETKDQDVMALEVGKDGHKMKEAPAAKEADPEAPAAKGERVINLGGQQIRTNQSGGAATISSAANGTQRITASPDGRIHMEIERMTMVQLADTLTPMTEFPVVDRTNLTGAYSLALDLSIQDLLGAVRRAGGGAQIQLNGGPPAGGPGLPSGLGAADPGGDLNAALQKLGLRLQKTKASMESLVVESAERVPTEN